MASLLVTVPMYFGFELVIFGITMNIFTIEDNAFNLLIVSAAVIPWLLTTAYTLNEPTTKHGWKLSLKLTGIISLTSPVQLILSQELIIGTFLQDGLAKTLISAWLMSPIILLYTIAGILAALICLIIARMIKVNPETKTQKSSDKERIEPTFKI